MPNIAVIFAGGTGQRMNTKTKPKQFLELHGKPILVYTLEQFDHHKDIDGIIVVMKSDWIDYTNDLIDKFRIKKVVSVVPGGESGQESIYNGLSEAKRHFPIESTVLIHDGVRPLVYEDTITKAIECVSEHGNAITVSPAIETITMKTDTNEVGEIIDRSKCMMAKAPQCFILGDILEAHNKAIDEKKTDIIDSASLMKWCGHTLYTIEGSPENIKITTPGDFYIFRAIMDARENTQIYGL